MWTLASKGLLSHINAIIGFAELNSISMGRAFVGVKLVAECFYQIRIWLNCFIKRAFRSIILRLCKGTVKSKILALSMGQALSCLFAAASSTLNMWLSARPAFGQDVGNKMYSL